ncbi:MAG: glycosyltransferase family 2 protein [Chlamydiia bacterium]|nr:glycosyltransferase family 2 protein [Chlamydiia bacterium]
MVEYSIVVPVKDEVDNIVPLVTEIEKAMAPYANNWELIYVDDGSSDGSLGLLQSLAGTHPFLRVLAFDRNYGQSSAFDAGFRHARGRFVISLDGDGQNDPSDIPLLISAADKADLVCGQRVQRKDSFSKRWVSKLSNIVRSRLCQDGVKDTGCSLKLYRKEALDRIKLFDGMHRFLPALFLNEGLRILTVPVKHRPRERGKTKYGFFNRNINAVMDMFAVMWMRRRSLHYRFRGPELGS